MAPGNGGGYMATPPATNQNQEETESATEAGENESTAEAGEAESTTTAAEGKPTTVAGGSGSSAERDN